MARQIPLSRARQIQQFIGYADRVGVPVDRLLERRGLTPRLRESADDFVSTLSMLELANDIERVGGIDDFGWRVGAAESPRAILGPVLTREMASAPSVLRALEGLIVLLRGESSGLELWIESCEDSILLWHASPLERDLGHPPAVSRGRPKFLIEVLRMLLGGRWMPPEIGLPGDGELGRFVQEDLVDTRIVKAGDSGFIRVPRTILARRPKVRPPHVGSGATGPEPAAADVSMALIQLVRPLLHQGSPKIDEAARLAGMSKRTLQRELAEAGQSYRGIVAQAKIDVARDLLAHPELKVLDVALETGFRDPAHFTRFFRGAVGLTPREYRKAHLDGHI